MKQPRLKPQRKPKLKRLLLPLLALSLLWCTLPAIANGQTKANGQTTKPTASTQAKSQASKTYDAKGKLIQKTDDKGRHYNAKGQYQGKTTRDGKHYDAKGKFTGKTVTAPSSSKSFDATGKLVEMKKNDDLGR